MQSLEHNVLIFYIEIFLYYINLVFLGILQAFFFVNDIFWITTFCCFFASFFFNIQVRINHHMHVT